MQRSSNAGILTSDCEVKFLAVAWEGRPRGSWRQARPRDPRAGTQRQVQPDLMTTARRSRDAADAAVWAGARALASRAPRKHLPSAGTQAEASAARGARPVRPLHPLGTGQRVLKTESRAVLSPYTVKKQEYLLSMSLTIFLPWFWHESACRQSPQTER